MSIYDPKFRLLKTLGTAQARLEELSAIDLYDDYKKGDRVVVNRGTMNKPVYFLGSITSKRDRMIHGLCDDGQRFCHRPTLSNSGLAGKSKLSKRKTTEVPLHQIHHYLMTGKEILRNKKLASKPSEKIVRLSETASAAGVEALNQEMIHKLKRSIYNEMNVLDVVDEGYVELIEQALSLDSTTPPPAAAFLILSVARILQGTEFYKIPANNKNKNRIMNIIRDVANNDQVYLLLEQAAAGIENIIRTVRTNA